MYATRQPVIPAPAGIQSGRHGLRMKPRIPAGAGMTVFLPALG